jgi:hypothetical protein
MKNEVIKEKKIAHNLPMYSNEWARIWLRNLATGVCYTVAINNCIQANYKTLAEAEEHYSRLVG